MKKKLFCTILSMLLVISALTGCSGNSDGSGSEGKAASAAETASASEAQESTPAQAPVETPESAETASAEAPEHVISYPLDQASEAITFWTTMPGNQTDIFPNGYNDHFLKAAVEEALGVSLDITSSIQIAMGDTTDFDLMIASGDWPDLLNVTGYQGGCPRPITTTSSSS